MQFEIVSKAGNLFDINNAYLGQVYDSFRDYSSNGFIYGLKLFLIFISIVLLVTVVIIKRKMARLKKYVPPKTSEDVIIPATSVGVDITTSATPSMSSAWQARWEEIERHINSPKEGEWKFAVIESDSLVNDSLKKVGFQGESMGDRLKNTQPGQIQNLDALWEAHKIRNRLAHDPDYFLRYAEAKRAVGQFEKVLRELEVL